MKIAMPAWIATLLVLSACGAPSSAPVAPPTLYAPANAVGAPILAVFEGRVPCLIPACEKTKVLLVFYESAASRTYWLATVNVGEGDDARTVTQGAWEHARGTKDYPQADVFELDANAPEALRRLWRVSDDALLPLDAAMLPRAGNASWGYMLSRKAQKEEN